MNTPDWPGLYAQGYRARLTGRTVLIDTPAGRTYRVDPAASTCSCPASVVCKHLRGWHLLLHQAADAVAWQAREFDDTGPGCRTEFGYTALGHRVRARVLAIEAEAWGMRLAADRLLDAGREGMSVAA